MTDGTDVDLEHALAWAEQHVGPINEVRELSGGSTSTMLAITPAAGPEVVLRVMTIEPWRTHGSGLTRREREVQGLLAESAVPLPRSVALDPEGAETGHPAHLMTRLPGRIDTDRVAETSLDRVATTLADLHDQPPYPQVRTYQSWAWEEKYVVPSWATDPALWRDAFDVLRHDPPPYEPCLIHRDFHLRNVLWDGEEVSGVVDWVETSIGPAWLDVAHCRTNLAIDHGEPAGDRFVRAYVARTGREPEPYAEVMDAVGFLPLPGRAGFVLSAAGRLRLQERLRCAMRDMVGA